MRVLAPVFLRRRSNKAATSTPREGPAAYKKRNCCAFNCQETGRGLKYGGRTANVNEPEPPHATMIIVSSLNHAMEAHDRFRPAYVVSILDHEEAEAPAFPGVADENHLRLISNCSKRDCGDADTPRCDKLIALARRWNRSAPILIHCNQGVARSMAAAYIIMCAVDEHRSERDIAETLRKAAPHADPNLLLISEADGLLNRDDRMIEAILDLTPSCGAVAKPIVTLPVAA